MIVVTVAFLIAVAGYAAWMLQHLSVRRRIVALAVLVTAAAADLWWVRNGGTIPVPLGYVMVISTDITDVELDRALQDLDPNAPVAFIALSPKPSLNTSAQWHDLREWRSRPEIARDAISEATQVSMTGDWGDALSQATIGAFRKYGPWLYRRPTVVCITDPGTVWQQLPQSGLDVPNFVKAFTDEDQLTLNTHPATGGGRETVLTLTAEQAELPAVPIPDLDQESVMVRLRNAPPGLDLKSVRVVCAFNYVGKAPDGTAASACWQADFSPVEFTTLAGVGGQEVGWRLQLNELKPPIDAGPAASLGEGLHLLDVTIHVKGESRESIYHAQTYLLARQKKNLVICGSAVDRPESISAAGWTSAARKALHPPDVVIDSDEHDRRVSREEQLLRAFIAEHAFRGQVNRSSRLEVRFRYADDVRSLTGPDLASFQAELANARGLILLEPSAEEINDLDRKLALSDLVPAGLNVMVAVPPVMTTPPNWLHTTAAPISDKSDRAVRVDRVPRVLIVFDTSRFMRLPIRSDGVTALDLQLAAANSLVATLDPAHAGPVFKWDNNARRVTCPAEPLFIPTQDSDKDKRADNIVIAPAFTYRIGKRLSNLMGEKDFGQSDLNGYLYDVLPGNVPLRLHGLFGAYLEASSDEAEPWLVPGVQYPETHVILFRSDPEFNVDASGVIATLNDGPDRGTDLAERGPVVDDLAKMGIAIHVVSIRQNTPGHLAFIPQGENGRGWSLPVPSGFIKRDHSSLDQSWDLTAAGAFDATTQGQKMAQAILESCAGTIDKAPGGRTVDVRVGFSKLGPRPAVAPEYHELLCPATTRAASAAADPAYSSPPRTAAAVTKTDAHDSLQLVADAAVGEGQVIVFGYSPFSADVWLRDVGKALPAGMPLPTQERFDGWGIQRLIDFVDLAGAVQPRRTEQLDVVSASVSPDESTLEVVCIGHTAGATWPIPTLCLPGESAAVPLEIVRIDPRGGTCVFRFRSLKPIKGPALLNRGKDASTPMYVDLHPSTAPVGGLSTSLDRIAALTGGEALGFDAALPTQAHQSSPWLAVLLLIVIAALMLSPIVTPWSGLFQWWLSRTRSIARHSGLSVEAMLVEWGAVLGKSTSLRIAGVPGGNRLFESGDRLGSAHLVSLLPFTTVGRVLGLPQRVPAVRVRHRTHNQSALILLDNTSSLLTPAATPNVRKSELARFLAGFCAGVIWTQDGAVRLRSSAAAGVPEFGPTTGLASIEAFDRHARRMLDAPHSGKSALQLPNDLTEGSFVFLISDVPSRGPAEINRFTAHCDTAGFRLRFLYVTDPAEYRLAGVGFLAGRGILVNRADVSAAALRHAYEVAATRNATLVSSTGHRTVTVSSQSPPAEILRQLAHAEIFEP